MSTPVANGHEGWCANEVKSASSALPVDSWRPYLEVDLGKDVAVSRVSAQSVTIKYRSNCNSGCTTEGGGRRRRRRRRGHHCWQYYTKDSTDVYCASKFYLAYKISSEQKFESYKLSGSTEVCCLLYTKSYSVIFVMITSGVNVVRFV